MIAATTSAPERFGPRSDAERICLDDRCGSAAVDRFGPAPDEIVTVWSYLLTGSDDESYGGISGGHPVAEWVDTVARRGHAATTASGRREPRQARGHRYFVHDDAQFCETRSASSQAAYYETSSAFGGPWWDNVRLAEWLLADARTGSGPTARFETGSDR